ncbi:MAG TPA: MMPL family transporter [Acidimicrobiales bacterium]|nr:MMPL family transporter [Acidimicrobiales bacterium]
MADRLYRLGHAAVRRRRLVLALWLALLFATGIAAAVGGGTTSDTFTLPGTESQRAADLLDERFPEQGGSTAQIVVADAAGVDSVGTRAAVGDLAAALRALPDVESVADPYGPDAVAPGDRTVLQFDVTYPMDAVEVPEASYAALVDAVDDARTGDIDVQMGGPVVDAGSEEEPAGTEVIGLAVAVVVLLVTFGSVLAMGMPLVTALLGVAISSSLLALLAAVVDLSSIAPTLAVMIGLAVGIDYALFIVTRHRSNLARGVEVTESIALATATAGGAVVFAGVTVIIAISGLAVLGVPFVTVMGLAAALGVAVAVAVALTLLPALLGFAGRTIDRLRLPGLRLRGEDEASSALGARWARGVTRRPWASLAGGLAVMGVLALPLADVRLAMADAGTQPASTTQRQAYDLVADGFGPGTNGPLTLVVDLRGADDPEAVLAEVTAVAAGTAGVEAVAPAVVNAAGDTAVVTVVPAEGPASAATERLVHDLRGAAFAGAESATGADVLVAGPTAANIDITDKLGGAFPRLLTVVVGLTVVVLLIAFRSVLVPLKAAVAILISIGSALGVVTAIFQWGWLLGLVGLDDTVPIVSFLPTMMFAVLFGLSMDYEVFIMSRVREEHSRTGDPRGAVLTGLASSARVITAAALIMISVFGGFILGDDPVIKMFGVGLSVAVLLDATIVRMLIVPAVMTLMDRAAWWLPGWLDRLLPDLDVEGERVAARVADAAVDTPGAPVGPALEPVGAD